MRHAWGTLAAIAASCAFLFCVGDNPIAGDPSDEAGAGNDGGPNGNDGATDGNPSNDGGPDVVLGPLATSASVAVGHGFSCALRANGHVFCWGSNLAGRLGRSTDAGIASPIPEEVSNISDGARIGAGSSHACVLHRDHGVSCWGSNTYGESADVAMHEVLLAPARVPGIADAVDLAVGAGHVCVRRADRTVWCWGANSTGQLGHVNTTDPDCGVGSVKCNPTPTKVDGLDADSLVSGLSHSCARVGDKAFCWGGNSQAQLGHTIGQNGDVLAGASYANPTPTAASATAVAALFAAGDTTCMTNATSAVSCWGADAFGQLGDLAALPNSSAPVAVPNLPAGILRVGPGFRNGCALDAAHLYCWGSTGNGSAGVDGGANAIIGASEVTPSLGGPPFIEIATPQLSQHRCGLTTAGTVFCWGLNLYGELGHANGTDQTCGGQKCNVDPILVSNLP